MTKRGPGTVRRPSPRTYSSAWLAVLGAVLLAVLSSFAGTGGASPETKAAEPPANRRPPRIEGTAQVGQILQANRGRWRRDRGAVFSYQWRLCDAAGTTCADVPSATDRIYPVRPANVGQRLLVAVSATTSAGKATASSAPTPIVRAAPEGAPVVTQRPTIGGKTELGSQLTAQGGAWEGTEPIRFQYRWRRCAATGGACEDLLGRTQPTYLVSERDAGHTVRVLVRAQNSVGTSAALSDATSKVPGAIAPSPATAPKNTSLPLLSGIAAQGKTLTASSGTWSGTTPMSFSFQWRRCARDGDDCATIARATQQTYTLVEADIGHTIRVRVTGNNLAGSSSAISGRSQVVVGSSAPVNTSPPTISGTARDGSVLTVSPGAWKGTQPIGFRYRWLRCSAGGGGCAAIPNASARSRTLTSADVGRTLRVRVEATNTGGSSAVLSGPSPVIAGKGTAPANRAAPVLSGTAQQGARLSLSTGSWMGTPPIAYSYRWERCDASVSGCRPIEGATGNTYVLARADVGHRLYGVVTAQNSAGSSNASSNATQVVIGAPLNRSLPTITGTPVEGQTLTASPGTWAGVGQISFGYQWTRCNAQGDFTSCVPIVVTSRPTYTLRAADVGRRVFVQVKALNRFGASFVNSAQTEVVSAAPIGTVTVRAARNVVVYGRSVVLIGRVVGAPSGEPVAIIEQPVGAGARVRENVTVTTAAGTWTYVARPTMRTTYQARIRGRTSAVVTVLVRPRLQLRRIGPGRVSVRIFAARSFAGRTAFLQRWNPKQHRWVTIRRVRLRPTRIGQAPTALTVATIRTRTPRGTLVRVVLPSRQAGLGYMTGTSNRVRT